MENNKPDICVLCGEDNNLHAVKLSSKGCLGLNATAEKKGDSLRVVAGQTVHASCRRKYCHPNQLRKQTGTSVVVPAPKTRLSNENTFDFKTKCFFCSKDAKCVAGKRGIDVHPVVTLEFQTTITEVCNRRGDDWAATVLGRLQYAQDLPAAEARYHQVCSANFRSGYKIPKQFQPPAEYISGKKGRPSRESTDVAFQEIVHYLEENYSVQMTVSDLVEKMKDICGEEEAYSSVYMKKRLLEHFGNSIVITELDGKNNVVSFKSTAHAILYSFYDRVKKNDSDSEKNAIIKTAARLILNDLKTVNYETSFYPSSTEIESLETNISFLPDSIRLFLEQIIYRKGCEKKIASIGQAIIQAAMPRSVIAPIQIGLAVQMHHHFGSKFLVDTLSSLGFCSSYQEVMRFESCAAAVQGSDLSVEKDQFVQFVADNVDHNIATIDGHNTFHGMGIITTITPKKEHRRIICRKEIHSEDLVNIGKIDIHFYQKQNNEMELMIFRHLADTEPISDKYNELDFLIKISRPLKQGNPGWSGIMQAVQTGSYPGQSEVIFLPMIDLNPSDLSCIYSTLKFVALQARKINATPMITFDQPLFWKALNIILNEPEESDIKKTVLCLGPFHTEMSFLGCIGKLTENSGLTELLETVYAPNTVGHMLSGKAVGRATRGHFLVYDALDSLLFKNYSECEEVSDENNNTPAKRHHHESVVDLIDKVMTKTVPVVELVHIPLIQDLMQQYQQMKLSLQQYRTSKLWLQYMEMIDILKLFLKAERTGNWQQHLKAIQLMLPYFAAAGHNLYLKSSYVYLQTMFTLAETHPAVFDAFMNGQHVIRRSDRFWGGLSTDLIIEQVLMRSVKSVGGMTRGRGMTESQRTKWLLAMPACAEMNAALQEFTGQKYENNDQHKECSKARITRDDKDRASFIEYLSERNPFVKEPCLRNIETGAIADVKVNVDESKHIGDKVLLDMEGKEVHSYTFKKAKQAITMGMKTSLKINDQEINIDPQLLFQRLIMLSDNEIDDTRNLFQYELCAFPSALFDSSGLLREAQKSQLASVLWDMCQLESPNIQEEHLFVLDGGSLVHRLPWTSGELFGKIAQRYTSLVGKHYGAPIVVFDGYICGPTTKDVALTRRTKGTKGTRVLFNGNTTFKGKKETFLTNPENKQDFINLLDRHLTEKGCKVIRARDDADVLIVQTAVEASQQKPVIVVGEDTDILALLLFHAKPEQNCIYLRSDSKNNSKTGKIWDIVQAQKRLGRAFCSHILLLHALTGCDTTSRVFGLSKVSAVKKYFADDFLKDRADVFLQHSSHADIETFGEQIIVFFYNEDSNTGINDLRYQKFMQKVRSSNTCVKIQTLPPTKTAAKYHSYRTYLQVQRWIGNNLNPLEWGWSLQDERLVPKQCDLPAAPERLLKKVKCCCKAGCDSLRCSCRKHGLVCSAACVNCKGINCSNVEIAADDFEI